MTADATPSTPPNGLPPSDDQTRSLAQADSTPAAAPTAAADSILPKQIGRYAIEGEIARGGMGVVLRAADPDFGRTLAVKVLLDRRRGDEAAVRRFLDEARLCGRLQHPGIPPVHEMGTLPDGRPFFAMKLVKGDTLAALLARRADPSEQLLRWLAVFEQVCQTVAYAHSRGVIHRDLKPANVMVGAFGEVQVMDWGLAKILREPTVSAVTVATESSTPYTTRGPGSPEQTAPGSILGTPAFMPPEQARGQVGRLDERADVFALGGILCAVLTGSPPYEGGDAAPVLDQAAEGDLAEARARLESCGADGELVRLTLACLAFRPADRPPDAAAVAAAIAAYRAGVEEQLRRAELARAAAQARAEGERKRRRLVVALAAAVLLLIAGGGGGAWWAQRQWAERTAELARQREAVETALDKAGTLRQQARWAEARAVLEQTRDRLGDAGPEDLRRRVEQASADLALVDRLDTIRLKRSAIVAGQYDDRGADRDYAATFRDAGLGAAREEAEAVAARLRASAVCEQLVAAVDDWAAVTKDAKRRAWLLEVARRGDPDEWRDRFRDLKVWQDRSRLEALARELLADGGRLARQKPPLLVLMGVALREARADPVPLLAAAQALHPDDFWLNFTLGDTLRLARRWDEAIGFYRGALAVRPSAVVVYNNLGVALEDKRQLDEAIQAYRKAIELDPTYALAHCNLGNALGTKGNLDEAIQEYRKAIELDPRDDFPHTNLGIALYAKGHLDEAIREYRLAIELDPKDARTHYNLGNALRARGQLDEAIQAYRKALELNSRHAPAHNELGNALYARRQFDEAIQEYRLAIDLDPKAAQPHYNLGNVWQDRGQLDDAIREYRKAIELDPRYAKPHSELGNVLQDKGQVDEAIREYRKAIELDPKLAPPHNNLGNALLAKGQPDEATQEYRQAIAFDPKDAWPHNGLGNVLFTRRHLDEAIEEYRQAIDLNPRLAQPHNGLGNVFYARGQLDEAIQEYRKAIEMNPRYARSHHNLGNALRARGQLDEAIQAYRKAIELDPKLAQSHGALGETLSQLGRFPEAREATCHGLDLLPPNDPLRQHFTRQLQKCEQLLALDQKLAAVREGTGAPADAAECLALAHLCRQPFRKYYGASARFFAEAFAADTRLTDDMEQQHRYNATCCAALAAAGRGQDAAALAEGERAGLRRQAGAWLAADRDAWRRRVIDGNPRDRADAQAALRHWQRDADLNSVRHGWSLLGLPADERRQWQRLWADVETLCNKASKTGM
jgi:tetratricopeptide (TPR) repeat protein